jgi:hypothetical protein
MMKISGEPGWGGDINIGEQPEAKTLRRDYTDWMHDPSPPDMSNWVIVGNQLYVGQDAHENMFAQHGHANSHKPFAYGRMALQYRWNVNFQIEYSNVSLHIVEKILRQYSNKNGWKLQNLVDRDGETIASPKAVVAALRDPHTVTFLLHENGKDYAVSQPGYRHHEILPMGGEVPRQYQQGSVVFFDPKWDDPAQKESYPHVIPDSLRSDPRFPDVLEQATLRHNYALEKEKDDFNPNNQNGDDTSHSAATHTAEVPGIGNLLPGLKDWRHTEWMEDTPPAKGYFEDPPKEKSGDGLYSCPDCGMEAQSYEQLVHHMGDHATGEPGHDWEPVVDYDQTMPAGLNTNSVPGWVALMSKVGVYDGQFADFYGGDDAVRVPFHHYPDTNEFVMGHPGDWHGSDHMRDQMQGIKSRQDPNSGEVVFTSFGKPIVHARMGR